MLQNTLINHVSFIVDRSSSMSQWSSKLVEVFDSELSYLKQKSIDLKQETRISIYLFGSTIEVLAFDMDVMHFNSLKGFYSTLGTTALIDATVRSISDHHKLPCLYGDHAFLQYVLTDGGENASANASPADLRKLFQTLPDNWTTAILVPNADCEKAAKFCGYLAGSISIWDTSSHTAMEGVGKQLHTVVDSYMTLRSQGVRGTKNLFQLDTKAVKVEQLVEVPTEDYSIYPVHKDSPIKEYVESWTAEPYRLGSTYYQPTKPVIIQNHKNILIQNIKNGRVYEGKNLRQLLGLPAETVKVDPGQHSDFRVFVQSASVNRKLFKNTFILVLH